MHHLKSITKTPDKAQSICTDIQSDFQAKLCFTLEYLTAFALPLINMKDTNGGG